MDSFEQVREARLAENDWKARAERAEARLAEAHQLLEEDYGNGVDNGYWPTVAPVLKRCRRLLGLPEVK